MQLYSAERFSLTKCFATHKISSEIQLFKIELTGAQFAQKLFAVTHVFLCVAMKSKAY